MKLEIFKPSDFDHITNNGVYQSDKANRLVNEWIEANGKVVYGTFLGESGLTDQHGPGAFNFSEKSTRMVRDDTTHTAILINITPIEKKCVEHEPELRKIYWNDKMGNMYGYINDGEPDKYKCKHCGVKLTATWTEV